MIDEDGQISDRQGDARAQVQAIHEEMARWATGNTPPDWVVNEKKRELAKWVPVVFADPTRSRSEPTASAGVLAPVQPIREGGDFVAREATPPTAPLSIPPYWLGRILGMSDYRLRYGGQLRSWRRR